MNEKLLAAIKEAVKNAEDEWEQDAIGKGDELFIAEGPHEYIAQAAIAATFAFIREQAGRGYVVEAGWAAYEDGPPPAMFKAMLDQIERTQNDD